MESLQKLKQYCADLISENSNLIERSHHKELFLNKEYVQLMHVISSSLGCNVKVGEDVMSSYMIVTSNKVEFKIINELNKYYIDVDGKSSAFTNLDDLINFIRNYNDISSSQLSFTVTYGDKQCDFKALKYERCEEKSRNTFTLGYISTHKYGIQIFNLYNYYSMDLVIDNIIVPIENIKSKSKKIENLIHDTYDSLDKLIDSYNELAYLLLKNTPRLIICRIITQRLIENDCVLQQMKSSWENGRGYIKLGDSVAVCITGFSFTLYDIEYKQLGYKFTTNIDDAINKIAMIPGNDIKTSVELFEKI